MKIVKILGVLSLMILFSCKKDLTDIVEQSEKASFIIYTYDEFGVPNGSGSGFFIDKTGIAITNYHVLNGATKAVIILPDSSKYEIDKIISANSKIDLIKFQIKNVNNESFPELKISTDEPKKGDKIYCISNPLGLVSSFSEGIVSAIRNEKLKGKTLQFSAPISPGSSGGAILNDKGEVVAIATYYKKGGQNLNFGIILNSDLLESQKENVFNKENPKFSLYDSFIILNLKSDNNPFHVLNAIEFGDNSTTIYLTYTNVQISDEIWGIWNPLNKMEKGFHLINLEDNSKTFIQTSTIGIDRDHFTTIPLGRSLKYKVYLPKINHKLKKISICEGENNAKWSNINFNDYKNIGNFDLKKFQNIFAFSLLKEGELESAKSMFLDILDEDPGNIEALNILGVISYAVDNNNDALYYFTKAIESTPTVHSSYINRYQVYKKQYKYNLAIDDISKAINLQPNQSVYYYYRSLLYKIIGDKVNESRDVTKWLELSAAENKEDGWEWG